MANSLNGDFEKIYFKAETVVTVSATEAVFRFNPPKALPRSSRANDASSDTTATWHIEVIGSQNHLIELRYEIPAFEQIGSDLTS